jgi:signal transduction histidine kinase/methylmalonyl-CoA mutase cobalamin-binding subunit
MEHRTLLIIDDSSEDRARVIAHISCDTNSQYRIIEAGSVSEALAALAQGAPDCVVLNQHLPDGEGLDFLRAASDDHGRLPFPAVVLADVGDPETAVALMKAGARDYLVKSNAAADAIRFAVTSAIYKVQTERQIEAQRREIEGLYAQTRENNDALRAANAAKDDFLAMLSHELRTPLTPVLSLVSSTINDPGLSADLRETFALIQRNVELEARLIDDLLDLTQIASGRLKIEKEPVDLHRCIEAALDVCHEGFSDKHITLRTELAATCSIVRGEFARLNQVFWNLLKNAVKFGRPNGSVAVTTDNDGGSVVVEIRDDGVGIDPGRLESIFGAFNPIKPTPTATGVGLGLAITRAIVEGHGGEIQAHSEGVGCGALFRIALPISPDGPPATSRAPSAPSEAVRGKTIMVVEDHDDTRRVLSRALRRKGFGVTAAGSVSAAVEQYIATSADLIICDIGLPDGTGWELIEKLRPHGPVRAIAVSGYGMEHDVKKSREAGFLEHLTKPIDFPRLENLIVETLAPEAR